MPKLILGCQPTPSGEVQRRRPVPPFRFATSSVLVADGWEFAYTDRMSIAADVTAPASPPCRMRSASPLSWFVLMSGVAYDLPARHKQDLAGLQTAAGADDAGG
jgi:hypothetical protein